MKFSLLLSIARIDVVDWGMLLSAYLTISDVVRWIQSLKSASSELLLK
jgi:hypothetical protein